MAYAAHADVTALINITFTTPTTATITTWTDQYSAIIDGILIRRGYPTVPATGVTDLLALKAMVTQIVAAQTWLAAFPSKEIPRHVQAWLTNWREFIELLSKGDFQLINQSPAQQFGVIQAQVYGE